MAFLALPSMIGSSPLARGLRIEDHKTASPCRIIPARAGFTFMRFSVVSGRWDHPRSRGVYGMDDLTSSSSSGSSPLARGLLCLGRSVRDRRGIIPARAGFTEVGVVARALGGIIPARAGFTDRRQWRKANPRDHPRSRGVYDGRLSHRAGKRGSSPLARGLQTLVCPLVVWWGIIPARAGFTPAPGSTS